MAERGGIPNPSTLIHLHRVLMFSPASGNRRFAVAEGTVKRGYIKSGWERRARARVRGHPDSRVVLVVPEPEGERAPSSELVRRNEPYSLLRR